MSGSVTIVYQPAKKKTTARRKKIVLTPPDEIETLADEKPEKAKPKRSRAKKAAEATADAPEEKT